MTALSPHSVLKKLLIVILWAFVPATAFAADLPNQKILPLALAQKAADAALNKCEADGYKVSVAVVDSGGILKALVRSDGAGRTHRTAASRKPTPQTASDGPPAILRNWWSRCRTFRRSAR